MTEVRYSWLEGIETPSGGPLKDAFIAVLNVFGDVAKRSEDGKCPGSLSYPFLASRMSCELCLTPQVTKKRLRALLDGQYLKEDYNAQVLFPKESPK